MSCQRSQSSSIRLLYSWDGLWGTGMIFGTVSGGVVSPVPPFATSMIILTLRCRPLRVDRMKEQALYCNLLRKRANRHSQKTQHMHHLRTAMADASSLKLELNEWLASHTGSEHLVVTAYGCFEQDCERSEARASQLTFG